jgi:hypothetical protein
MVHGVMGRFSDGEAPTQLMVNTQHVTFWQPVERDGGVLIHFLHGSGIEVTETLTELDALIRAGGDGL